jgi:hypothetical protein
VSRSSPSELRIALSPGRVELVQLGRTLSWRGRRLMALTEHVETCRTEDGAPLWHAALRSLERTLPGLAEKTLPATVILSNRFLRYALVPWSADLAEGEEEMAYARHCFAEVHGAAAGRWALRLSRGKRGAPRLASAVDPELLDGLRGVFAKNGLTIQSIQPQLMAVVNRLRGQLNGRATWLAVLEPEHLLLALLSGGRWVALRGQRVGAEWRDELALMLQREGYLSDLATATRDVLLWAPGQTEPAANLPEPWNVRLLSPGHDATTATEQGITLAIAP